MIAFISDFLLSEWIWSITWGMYHIPINCIIMFFLAKMVVRSSGFKLALIVLMAHLFSFLAFFGIVFGVVFITSQFNYMPARTVFSQNYSIYTACLLLGFIYAGFQSLFFYMINKKYTINLRYTILISFLSNITSAQIVYLFLPYK